jgi:3'(2'), 5'-bisphosphate nucleotidase
MKPRLLRRVRVRKESEPAEWGRPNRAAGANRCNLRRTLVTGGARNGKWRIVPAKGSDMQLAQPSDMTEAPDALALYFAELVLAAGSIAMAVRAAPEMDVRAKADSSPVSAADERVEAFLLENLRVRFAGAPIVAEESAAKGAKPQYAPIVLLVDPVDGTKDFIAGGAEFTVNVALVRNGVPLAGAIYAPALSRLWFAGREAYAVDVAPDQSLPERSAWRRLAGRPLPAPGARVALASRSHLDSETSAYIARAGVGETRQMASSLKFCKLAEGEADLYPRFGPTMQWDIAAGDAILRAAGGATLDAAGAPLLYAQPGGAYRSPSFVAFADAKSARIS